MTEPLTLDTASDFARTQLASAYRRLFPTEGSDLLFEGQLLRPVLAVVGAAALAGTETVTDERFWFAALAVQLAHEASLVHDDVVDQASTRRDRPTTFASRGTAAAVLEGDLLLTGAYVAAAATQCSRFVSRFATAVSRTVIAEKLQGSWMGKAVRPNTYEHIAAGKAGELMGCALAAGAMIAGENDDEFVALGREIGLLYQMMDDFLDYCPSTHTGKPALGDYTQGRWTWPLEHVPDATLGIPVDDVLSALHARGKGTDSNAAIHDAADWLRRRIATVSATCESRFRDAVIVREMLTRWSATVSDALERETVARRAAAREALVKRFADLEAHSGEAGYLAHHSRSFSFASKLLPRDLGRRIARVYAFCRFTDDLADEPTRCGASKLELIDEWVAMAAMSYSGTPAGLPVLDRTMLEMREAGVPFNHVADLCRGMRMDIEGTNYATLGELRLYTYRVAGVVGLWIAQLAGVRDMTALANAERMGHAMQLTNILRDVGEDWRNGRLYLPLEILERHGLKRDDVGTMVAGTLPVSDAYRAMMRELVAIAHDDYSTAFAWLPSLPEQLQPGMAVAAGLYEAIHEALERNDYDNLHNRAATSLARKVGIASHALRSLRQARKLNVPLRTALTDQQTIDDGWPA